MAFATPQPGIFAKGGTCSWFMEYTVFPSASSDRIRQALSGVVEDRNGPHRVVAFGADLWRRLCPDAIPEKLRSFQPIGDPGGFFAPATQRDILIWLHGDRHDLNFDRARAIHRRLSGVAELDLEVTGFAYHENRDIIGFVDGTANPKDDEGKRAAALLADGGGSYVLTQKWVHDLDAFNDLSVPLQESVVGRTKEDDIELEGDSMPPDSHVSRTDVSENGTAMKIYRRSAPFGTVGEHGLYFLGFACDIRRFQVQLERMYGVYGDGVHDRLIEFSKAVTGAYWYAPGVEQIKKALAATKA